MTPIKGIYSDICILIWPFSEPISYKYCIVYENLALVPLSIHLMYVFIYRIKYYRSHFYHVPHSNLVSGINAYIGAGYPFLWRPYP